MSRPNPFVAASSQSDPLRPAIEARSDAQPMTPWGPWIVDEVEPFDPFDDGEPVPTLQAAMIFAGLFAGAVLGWGLIYAAAKLVATGQAMFL